LLERTAGKRDCREGREQELKRRIGKGIGEKDWKKGLERRRGYEI
jgi:hypothetical protein